MISTHVLDLELGLPAVGMVLDLYFDEKLVNHFTTDQQGRVAEMLVGSTYLKPGIYKLVFKTQEYFSPQKCFYPKVEIEFEVFESRHHHVPLLINRFGFSTYRGS